MALLIRRYFQAWNRAAKTLFVLATMVASLLVHSYSPPLLLALLDIGIPSIILSTIWKSSPLPPPPPPAGSSASYDFRSSLLDILIVSMARSLVLVSASAIRGLRCQFYFIIALLLGLISAAMVAVKACFFLAAGSSSSRSTGAAAQSSSSSSSATTFAVVMLFSSSFACALGHGVLAYRTSCQAKKIRSFPPPGDEESNFLCKYNITKRFRSTVFFPKYDEEVEQLPLPPLDDGKFMPWKSWKLHYKLFPGWRKNNTAAAAEDHQTRARSKTLSRSASLSAPGRLNTPLLCSSPSLPAKVLLLDVDELSRETTTTTSGKGIVLIHGFGGGVFSWRHVMDPLARQTGYSVASFDRPGWGLTSRTKKSGNGEDELPNPYDLQSQVDLLLSFCQELEFLSVVLVGHDDGGLLALMAAAKTLECPSSPVAVKGVVLIGVSSGREAIPAFARALLHTSLGRRIVRPLLCSRMASRRAWQDASKLAMELYKAPLLVEGWNRQGLESRKFSSSIGGELLGRVQRVPSLLVAGMQDMLVPLQAVQNLASQLSNSKLVAIPRCGHLPPEECPDALMAALVPFIAEHLSHPS